MSHRPYLNVYAHSDENEEVAVIGLTGVNVECNPEMEALLGVSCCPSVKAAAFVSLISLS